MAVEYTGTPVAINSASSSSSQSVAVPVDCDFALVFFGGADDADDSGFNSGGGSVSLGGVSGVWRGRSTAVGLNGDVCVFSVASPPTGSQTFSWTLDSGIDYGYELSISFYKNVDSTSPIRSIGGNDAGAAPASVSGLDYGTGDMMVGGVGCFDTPTMTANSQTQVALIGPAAKGSFGLLGVAYRSDVGSFSATGATYWGAVALVLRAASASATLTQHSFRVFNDDGSESASTAKAAINTSVNLSASDVARIRFLIDATGDPSGKQFQLECRRKPSGGSFGDWKKVS